MNCIDAGQVNTRFARNIGVSGCHGSPVKVPFPATPMRPISCSKVISDTGDSQDGVFCVTFLVQDVQMFQSVSYG